MTPREIAWPRPITSPGPILTPYNYNALGSQMNGLMTAQLNAASATYVTANLAVYYPFCLEHEVKVTALFVMNGAVVSGNIDLGIYDEAGRRIVSTGSTAQAGTDVPQQVDISDTIIGPGDFYMALALDNTTGTVYRGIGSTTISRIMGILQQASAFALPTTATFAAASHNNVYLFGLRLKGSLI